MVVRPPRSPGPSSARAPPSTPSHPACSGRGARPSTTSEDAARGRCSEARRTSASRVARRGVAHRAWMAALPLELQAGRPAASQGASLAEVSRETVPSRATPPRLPLEEAASGPARERLRGADRGEADETRRRPANDGGGGLLLPGRDQAGDQPQSGLLLDAQGESRGPLAPREPTARCGFPGRSTSERGDFTGSRGSAGTTSCSSGCSTICAEPTAATSSCTWRRTTTQATPANGRENTWRTQGGRVRLHPLPSWSPESNPVELVWWSLHEAVSRNHECAGLDDWWSSRRAIWRRGSLSD